MVAWLKKEGRQFACLATCRYDTRNTQDWLVWLIKAHDYGTPRADFSEHTILYMLHAATNFSVPFLQMEYYHTPWLTHLYKSLNVCPFRSCSTYLQENNWYLIYQNSSLHPNDKADRRNIHPGYKEDHHHPHSMRWSLHQHRNLQLQESHGHSTKQP